MEVLSKKRSLLVILSLIAILGTNIPVCAIELDQPTAKTSKRFGLSNWFKRKAWSPIKIGVTAGLSILGYAALSKISKRPLLNMTATTGISVFLAHKLSNSSFQKGLKNVETKIETNGDLIKTATNKVQIVEQKVEQNGNLIKTAMKKIQNLWNYVKNEFTLVKTRLTNLEKDLQEVKETTLETKETVKDTNKKVNDMHTVFSLPE